LEGAHSSRFLAARSPLGRAQRQTMPVALGHVPPKLLALTDEAIE